MDEPQNAEPTADETGTEAAPSAPPSPDASDEVEQWRTKWETAARELEELRAERMTEQEKALVQAHADGRSAALSELAPALAEAEIRAQAATAGVSVQTEYLDLNRFLKDGRPDAEQVSAFIAKQAPARPNLPKLMGAGHHPGGAITGPTTMDPNELVDYINGKSNI
ncbi:hypothetical protein [Streptomyces luteireticuli]|uniref:Scaffolding protein n=1 Tax=Streptomyces luteireticuli TaxID=173858 RepID=A0ABP3ILN3_9ACTN